MPPAPVRGFQKRKEMSVALGGALERVQKKQINYWKKLFEEIGGEDKKLKEKDEKPSSPDEVYPINWVIKHIGKPHTPKFKKHIRDSVSTFTEWEK